MTSPVTAPIAYTDYASLRHSVGEGQQGIEDAARHFESMFIDMWLKAARQANEALAEDNFMNSSEMQMRQEMFDHEMSVHIAQGGGIGLAPAIIRQLGGEADMPLRQPAQGYTGPSPSPSAGEIVVENNGTKLSAFASPEEFVSRLRPMVEKLATAAGLPALAVLGQAALETGWGSQVIGRQDGTLSHNLFGMKSSPEQPEGIEVRSKEFEFGRWIDRVSSFRGYPDWEASVQDYIGLLQSSPRYQQAVDSGQDAQAFLQRLQSAGYATDPDYAGKILQVMRRIASMDE